MALLASALLVMAWQWVYPSVMAAGPQLSATVAIRSALTGTDTVDVACIGEPSDERVLVNKKLQPGDQVQWSFSTSIVDSSYVVCDFRLQSVQVKARANVMVWFGPTKFDQLCERFRYRCDICTWEVHLDALYVRDDQGLLYPCRDWTIVS